MVYKAYEAVYKDGQLIWKDERPEEEGALQVIVTVLPASQAGPPVEEVAPLSEEELKRLEADPMWNIVGLFDSGIEDLGERHDYYLTELYRKEADQ
jgi:hypothetical protein